MSTTDEVSKEELSLTERIEAILQKAEDRVLFPDSSSVKAKICGRDITLRPLPIYYAKKVGNRIQNLVNLINGNEEDREKWRKGANDLVADAFVECLVDICSFYEEDITGDMIQKSMTTAEVKAVIIAQAQLNEESDFLLQPLHIIIMLISGAEEGIKNVRKRIDTASYEETLASSLPSVKTGESDMMN